jgi:hypothetical protein
MNPRPAGKELILPGLAAVRLGWSIPGELRNCPTPRFGSVATSFEPLDALDGVFFDGLFEVGPRMVPGAFSRTITLRLFLSLHIL